ncbi:MAG: hypothetical protein HUJ63_07180 [Enterococcus sp.]|nr:hypothetical protein [Enterococcus sp.]
MKKYIYQKFLLHTDYDDFDIESVPKYTKSLEEILEFPHKPCLFDQDKVIRKLDFYKLDTLIDTIEDWNKFIKEASALDELILYCNNNIVENPIIRDYRSATINAYLNLLLKSDMNKKIYIHRDI